MGGHDDRLVSAFWSSRSFNKSFLKWGRSFSTSFNCYLAGAGAPPQRKRIKNGVFKIYGQVP